MGGLCPITVIVKLSMPKGLGEKNGSLIRNFTQTTVLVDSDVFLQGQIKTKYNKENRCKLFFLLVAFFWNPQDLSTINGLHVRIVESC